MFMLKSIVLASLMFVSVLFGMQQANDGLHKMKGYDDPGFKSAFKVKEDGDGNFKSSILGSDVSSHDLEQKRKKLEKMKAYNFFSSLGKNLAEGISNAVEKAINLFAKNNEE